MLGPMRPYGPDSPWRFAPGLTYLTHGTFGATPVPILERQRQLIDELEADPIQVLYREFEPRRDVARSEVARFVGADPEGVVVVPNVTTAVSTVIRSLRLRPGLALPLVWLFNLVGITDLLFAVVQGVITGLPFSHIGVAWFIPTVYVPLLLVIHITVFWFLLRAAPSTQAGRESAVL